MGEGGAAAVAGHEQRGRPARAGRGVRRPSRSSRSSSAASAASPRCGRDQVRLERAAVLDASCGHRPGSVGFGELGPHAEAGVDLERWRRPRRSQVKRSRTRAAASSPMWTRSEGLSSRRPTAAATAAGSWGGTSRPVPSVRHRVEQPADRRADDGDAARHRLERHDPERLVPGDAGNDVGRPEQGGDLGTGDRAQQAHAVGDAEAAGEVGSRRASGSMASSSACGPPATTQLGAGEARGARAITSSIPLRGTSRLDDDDAVAAVPGRGHGSGGAERRRDRSRRERPRWRRGRRPGSSSSSTSSRQVATTWSASRTSCRPRPSTRSGGLVSASPWWRRLTTPRAWNVRTTGGSPSGRAASSAAQPGHPEVGVDDVGPADRPTAPQRRAKAGMCGQRSSFGTGSGGPARTCSTRDPRCDRHAGRQVGVVAAGWTRRRRSRGGRGGRPARRRGRSGRRRRRRRARPAGWRARRPARPGAASSAPPPVRPPPERNRSRAATTSAAVDRVARQRLLVERADATRQPAHATCWSPSTDVRHAPGPPAIERHRGSEGDDDGCTDGCGRCIGPVLPQTTASARAQHAAEPAKAQASSEIDHTGRLPENRFSETRFFLATPVTTHPAAGPGDGGDHGAPPVGGERCGRARWTPDGRRRRPVPVCRPRARRRAAASRRPGRRPTGRPPGTGTRSASATSSPRRTSWTSGSPGMRTSSNEPAWSWLTAAIRSTPAQPQQQRERQRALVRTSPSTGGVGDARRRRTRVDERRRPRARTPASARPRSTARGTSRRR